MAGPANDPTGADPTRQPQARRMPAVPRVHPTLHKPLGAVRWVAAFIGFGLLGDLVAIILANGFNNLPTTMLSQVRAVADFARANAGWAALIGIVVLAVLIVAVFAGRQQKQDADAAEAHAREEIAEKAALRAIATVGIGQSAIPTVPLGLIAPEGGLPRSTGELVGRDDDLRDLMSALTAGTGPVGVFAVEGLAGVGKTALAAEAAAQLAADKTHFPGGVVWISCEGLAGADELAEVWSRVARALGADQVAALPEASQRRAALRAALSDPARPRLLLALDNVEPGLDADALLDTLANGQATLLLTAREAVAPARVTALPLAPLPDPDAVRLFVRRLRQVDAKRPKPEDAPAIATLVELLGGLPLAVELAAAYAGVQRRALSEVVDEVQRDGVSAGALQPMNAGTPNPRQTGVATRINRSWRALTPSQQQLFAGLALLEGASFPRAAAEALITAARAGTPATPVDGDAPTPPPAADLDALVTLALVEALRNGRLRLHPLLRDYAADRLRDFGPAMEEPLGDAMLAFWIAYAQANRYKRKGDIEHLDALEAEAPALMGALTWAHDNERHREVLALIRPVGDLCFFRGRVGLAQRAHPWGLESAIALGNKSEQLYMQHELAVLDAQTGHPAAARAGYERALSLARELGDPAAERVEVHELAVLDRQAGHLAEARAGYERALALARALGDPAAERAEVHALAVLDAQTGHLAEARVGYERALSLARALGDPAAERAEVHALAVLDGRTGHLAEARAGFERALALARQLGDPAAERFEVHDLAVLDDGLGNLQEARHGYEGALEIARRLGDPSAEAAELRDLGELIERMDEPERGRALIVESLAIYERLGDTFGAAECHKYLAWIARRHGTTQEAVAEFTLALRLYEQVQSPLAEEVRADLRRLEVEA